MWGGKVKQTQKKKGKPFDNSKKGKCPFTESIH